MKKVLGLALALLLGFGIAGAWAEDIAGKVQSVNADARVVVLEDGTQLSIAEGLSIDTLKEGVSVKASYEERDGKKVVTTFTVGE